MTTYSAGSVANVQVVSSQHGTFTVPMYFTDNFLHLVKTEGGTVPDLLKTSTNTVAVESSELQLAIEWKIVGTDKIPYSGTYYEDSRLNKPMQIGSTVVNVDISSTDDTRFVVEMKPGTEQPIETRAYVVTFVNQFGEESAPSDPVEIQLDPGMERATLTIEASRLVNEKIANLFNGHYVNNGLRVYRTATSSTGDTEFLYAFSVGGAGLGGTDLPGDVYLDWTTVTSTEGNQTWTVTDTVETAALGAACPTLNNIRDTNELQSLQGLISINNGMTASFKNNEVWITDPYTPWAFRSDGIHTIRHKVVSLVPLESGFVALTDGSPYYFSGQVPEQMASQVIPGEFPCINKNAAAAIGGAVSYISPDGPVVINGMQAILDTKTWSREKWRDEYGTRVNKIALANYGHRLLAYWPGEADGYIFDMDDGNWSRISTRMDCAMRLPSNSFSFTFDQLAFAQGDTVNPRWSIFGNLPTTKNFVWHSKTFRLPIPTNLGVVQLFGTGYATVDVYVDGALTYTTPTLTLDAAGTIARLPSGFRSTKWSFKINGAANSTLTGFNVATSIAELQSV